MREILDAIANYGVAYDLPFIFGIIAIAVVLFYDRKKEKIN
jgi:hypothetical protein